jgi:rhodanese-related sulfurtransferase
MAQRQKLKFISIEKLLEMMENKEHFKLIEVLGREDYKEGHLPGAINIPVNEIEKVAPSLLKKNETIVVYCRSYSCHASTESARKLLSMGYKKVYDYKGGKKVWLLAGLELER